MGMAGGGDGELRIKRPWPKDDIKTRLYIIVTKRCYRRILPPHKHAIQIKERRH